MTKRRHDIGTITDFVKQTETKKKERLNNEYPTFGCFAKGHKTTKEKKISSME